MAAYALGIISEEPNAKSLETIAEGNVFLASGEPGRSTDTHGMIKATPS